MGITGNEISAVNQQRQYEELSQSAVGGAFESGASVASAAVALGTSLVAGGPAGLAVAGSVVAGMGIVEWFRRLGASKVNENLESLGQATEDALNRVENVLREHGTAIEDIKRRLESEDFRNAMASASLQALRTTQQDRLKRLALILANGVKDNDLGLDSVDDMMRAAVELTEKDILELGALCSGQSKILADAEKSPMQWPDNVRAYWQQRTIENHIAFREGRLSYRDHVGSYSRLAAFGFVAAFPARGTSNSPEEAPYALLPEGKRFYERLQEIAAGG